MIQTSSSLALFFLFCLVGSCYLLSPLVPWNYGSSNLRFQFWMIFIFICLLHILFCLATSCYLLLPLVPWNSRSSLVKSSISIISDLQLHLHLFILYFVCVVSSCYLLLPLVSWNFKMVLFKSSISILNDVQLHLHLFIWYLVLPCYFLLSTVTSCSLKF